MNAITIVGIGSPHVNDQLGWQVIDYLKRDHALQTLCEEQVKLIACDRPGASLLDYLKGANLAILVDAIEGGEAGKVRCLRQEQLLINDEQLSSHNVGVAEALILGEKLGLLPDTVVLYGMETGHSHEQGDVSEEKIAEIVSLIIGRIESSQRQDKVV